MTKTKFIFRCAGYAVGKVAGLVLALWLVSCGQPPKQKPLKTCYFAFHNNAPDSIKCQYLYARKGCLYASMEEPYIGNDIFLGCGTFKIIHKKP